MAAILHDNNDNELFEAVDFIQLNYTYQLANKNYLTLKRINNNDSKETTNYKNDIKSNMVQGLFLRQK